jgi:hypothetical protein
VSPGQLASSWIQTGETGRRLEIGDFEERGEARRGESLGGLPLQFFL